MSWSWLDFIILIFALNGMVECWWHSDMPLIANIRARLQAGSGFFGQLGRCPWCSSHWVGMFILVVLFLPGLWFWWWPGRVVLLWLAIVRGANLLNDCTHKFHRTPRD